MFEIRQLCQGCIQLRKYSSAACPVEDACHEGYRERCSNSTLSTSTTKKGSKIGVRVGDGGQLDEGAGKVEVDRTSDVRFILLSFNMRWISATRW